MNIVQSSPLGKKAAAEERKAGQKVNNACKGAIFESPPSILNPRNTRQSETEGI